MNLEVVGSWLRLWGGVRRSILKRGSNPVQCRAVHAVRVLRYHYNIYNGNLVYFMVIWYTYVVVIWYIFHHLGMFHQEKSGNLVF
jgi:hypothetical protein